MRGMIVTDEGNHPGRADENIEIDGIFQTHPMYDRRIIKALYNNTDFFYFYLTHDTNS